MRFLIVCGVALLLAACQGTTVDSTSGEGAAQSISLTSGFLPDPRQRDFEIVPFETAVSPIACPGFYPARPALELQFQATSTFDLFFYGRGYDDADLVLGVVTPEGEVLCNDDGWYDLNPRVVVGAPSSGRYLVWIGTYTGAPASARLFISELSQGPQIRDLR